MEQAAYSALVAASFLMGFTMPGARVLLVISLLLLVVHKVRSRERVSLPSTFWLGLAFFALTAVVTIWGVHPELGVPKLRKFFWYIGLPLAAVLASSRDRVLKLLAAYALGVGVLAVRVVVENPFHARQVLASGRCATFAASLIDVGSMTNGQRLMLGIVISLGFLLASGGLSRRRWMWALLLILQSLALVVNLKRGAWFCTFILVAGMGVSRLNWRWIAAMGLACLSLLAVPLVRERLADVATEFSSAKGGRWLMWHKIAPELIRQHPWGLGYRSLTNDMMRDIDARVEPQRDHLHSNFLQVLVESGWAGLVLGILWIGTGLRDGWRYWTLARLKAPLDAMPALALLLMLAGLVLHGVVEYNLGDAELVLVYGLVMGVLAAGCQRLRPAVATPS